MTETVFRDAWADLVTGSRCVGCERSGPLLCPECRGGLPASPYPTRPTPCPAGLVTCWTSSPYAGLVRELVLGHKEHGLVALRTDLGGLLALAVAGGLATVRAGPGPVLLVPVPSRRAATRARGHDPTAAIVGVAAARLRRLGHDVRAARLLVVRGPVRDQSGLTAEERAANLAGSLAVRRSAARRGAARVVLCDDVLTTGATLREAQRALAETGHGPVLAATVAATVRRRAPPEASLVGSDIHDVLSGPALVWGRGTH